MADVLFNQADTNKDERLDLNEFRALLAQNLGVGTASYGGGSFQAESGFAGGVTGDATGGFAGGFAGGFTGAEGSYGAYEQASFSSASTGGFDAGALAGGSIQGFGGSASSDAAFSASAAGISASSTYETSASHQQLDVATSSAQNIFKDPNPQVVRRPAPGGSVTYTQNIRVRFLQPPAVPPPGPLIIKEVRPPQPPLPPPLRIRQQAPPLPQPPPLILREKPPVPPAAVASQTVIRKLAAIPVPPRSVIIERLPALPPKPRDIIIERWVPYGPQAKRKTIVQKAAAAKEYPKPRNVIIQYEPVQVRVIRQFQRLGVAQENPQAYVQRYGVSLLDAQTLVQQARSAGVVEDISPPYNAAASASNSASFGAEFAGASSGFEAAGGSVAAAAASSSSFESFGYGSGQQENASFSGFEASQGVGVAHDFSTSYESGSSAVQGDAAAFGGASASSYESYSAGGAAGGQAGGFESAAVAFQAADINKDGTLDVNEFRQFLASHLKY